MTEIKWGLPFDCEMWLIDCSCIHSVLIKVTMACNVYMKEGWLENMDQRITDYNAEVQRS